MRKYFWLWTAVTLGLALLVAMVNYAVDPYRVFGWMDLKGFNQVKPNAGAHAKVAKAFAVVRASPRSLVLGNSRAEVGFDPKHPRWPREAGPVFNLALPGTGTSTAVGYLNHVLAAARRSGTAKPSLIVLGLDFIDFLPDPVAAKPAGGELPVSPWERMGSKENADLRTLKDATQSLLSISALLDSASTVVAQRDPYARDLTSDGFNPMQDYVKLATIEGYRTLFRQKNASYIGSFSSRAKNLQGREAARKAAFADLSILVGICQHEGIELKLVLYPYHAHFLEAIRLTGLWAEFEKWKIELVDRISSTNDRAAIPVPVWDFSHYNRWTTEEVPATGDKRSNTHWYWEAGHFKKELGDLVLDRVLASDSADDDFGVRLTRTNVTEVVLRDRSLGQEYLKAFPAESSELRSLLRP